MKLNQAMSREGDRNSPRRRRSRRPRRNAKLRSVEQAWSEASTQAPVDSTDRRSWMAIRSCGPPCSGSWWNPK